MRGSGRGDDSPCLTLCQMGVRTRTRKGMQTGSRRERHESTGTHGRADRKGESTVTRKGIRQSGFRLSHVRECGTLECEYTQCE